MLLVFGGVNMSQSERYLPHLINAVPKRGYGNRLSMYLIALEAWRRGLNVKFYLKDNPENKLLIRYSLSDNTKEYHFESSMGDKLTSYAYEVCENKDETKKVLKKSGVPVPEGKRFVEEVENNEIINYARELGYPVVVKPVSENAGKGVFSNIQNEEDFIDILHHVRNDLGYQDIIVEKYIVGIEYRIFLIEGKVVAAVNRVPANIIGDGTHTIEELIDLKNKSKQDNPTVSSKIIVKDKEVTQSINELGYDYYSIPLENEKIYLRKKSNVSAGGDSIDVTENLTPELIEIAERAMDSIAGLNICGLDMIVDEEENTGTVIEINTKPMLGLHVFPVEGTPRDIVTPIIDHYFPKTKGKNKSQLYFNFDAILAPLRDRSVKDLVLSSVPETNKLIMKKYIIDYLKGTDSQKEIRLLALKNDIYGYLKENRNEEYELVIASDKVDDLDKFIELIKQSDIVQGLTLDNDQYEIPIKSGFEIYRYPKDKRKLQLQHQQYRVLDKKLRREIKLSKKLEKSSKKLEKEVVENRKQNSIMGERIVKLEKRQIKLNNKLEKLKEENKILKEEQSKLLNSNSWKYTKLIRAIENKLKRNHS